MKRIIILVITGMLLYSCSIFKSKDKYGCPGNGKNIGAERILSGNKMDIRAARKAKKFKT